MIRRTLISSRIALLVFPLCFIAFLRCGREPTEISQVSLNIQEAKTKRVFLSEYQVIDLETLKTGFSFPINSVWEEKPWILINDKTGCSFRIQDSTSNRLVIGLNNVDTIFTEQNFIKGKWIMWMDSLDNSIGSIRGMINFSLVRPLKDGSHFTLYLKKNPTNFTTDLVPIFRFRICCK